MSAETGYLAALLVTLAVEVPLYALALRGLLDQRGRAAVAAAVAVNVSSHPLAWFVVWPATDALLAVEAFAVAWEAALLYAWLRREPVLLGSLALLVNGASLLAGALL